MQKEVAGSPEQSDIGWGDLGEPRRQRPGLGQAKPHLAVIGIGSCPDGSRSELAQLELRAWQPRPP